MSISMRSGALPTRWIVPSTLPAVAGSICVIGWMLVETDTLELFFLHPALSRRMAQRNRANWRDRTGREIVFTSSPLKG